MTLSYPFANRSATKYQPNTAYGMVVLLSNGTTVCIDGVCVAGRLVFGGSLTLYGRENQVDE